jgi:lipopolysaccharide export system permease protein
VSCIDRYIAVALMKGWTLVLVILLAVFSLFVFVAELDHVDSRYHIVDALRFVVFTMPQRALDLSPVISLLGSLAALAALAKHNELIGIQAAGITLARLVRSVAAPATLLIMLLALVSEYIAAPLYQKAETQRSITQSANANMLKRGGLWSNNGQRFFNVHTLRLGRIPYGIDLYEFKPDGQLRISIHANHAEVGNNSRKWNLIDVRYKELIDDDMVSRHLPELDMGPFWSRDELPVLSISTAGMSLSGLYEYIRYLTDTGQRTERFELAFWRKTTIPLAAGIMVLLATPIGAEPNPQRRTAFGRRIAIGSIIGIFFYLGTQIIHATGLLLQLNMALITLSPILILLAASVFLLYRMRW